MSSPSKLLLLLALIFSRVLPADSLAAEGGTTSDLAVMTFNLRYASTNSPNSWAQRRPVMRACIQEMAPDLIGTQEGLYQQLKDLASDLPQYSWLGTGRDGGSHGEFMAIFYRRDRFEPLEFDHFWLSDTPNVIASTTWGNRNRRMVTWVRFLDRQAQREFYFFNTHLDHEIQGAREKAAALIRQRAEGLKTTLPVLLVGDFNAAAQGNKAYDILTENAFLADAWISATSRKNETLGTFHNYQSAKEGPRIDWILLRGPVQAESAEIVTFSQNGQYPSDHFPVVSYLRWIR